MNTNPGTCKRCNTRQAEAPDVSAFLLCEVCADELYDELCPGPSVEQYMELVYKYGR